jgi:hypothetical protein
LFSYASNSYRKWQQKILLKINDLRRQIMFCVFPYQFLFSPLRKSHVSNQPYSPFLLFAATQAFVKALKPAAGHFFNLEPRVCGL